RPSFLLTPRPPPRPPLFPYTTLFRSPVATRAVQRGARSRMLRATHADLPHRRRRPRAGGARVGRDGRRRAMAGVDGVDAPRRTRSEEHTSELQSLTNLVCRLLLEKKK